MALARLRLYHTRTAASAIVASITRKAIPPATPRESDDDCCTDADSGGKLDGEGEGLSTDTGISIDASVMAKD